MRVLMCKELKLLFLNAVLVQGRLCEEQRRLLSRLILARGRSRVQGVKRPVIAFPVRFLVAGHCHRDP